MASLRRVISEQTVEGSEVVGLRSSSESGSVEQVRLPINLGTGEKE